MVVPVIAAAGAATGRVIASKIVTNGKAGSAHISKNPNQKKYLDGIQKEQGEIHKKKYLASLKKEQQEKQQKELYGEQNALTTTGDRILNKRVAVQNVYRKKNGIKGYIGRKMLPEQLQNFDTRDPFLRGFELSAEKKPDSLAGVAYTNYKRLKAGKASWTIFWVAIYFWPVQVAFSFLAIAGYGMEAVPLLNIVLPGTSVVYTSYAIVMVIGLTTLIGASLFYTFSFVDSFGGWKLFIFAFCIIGYCVPLPLLQMWPWFIFWLFGTTLMQGKR